MFLPFISSPKLFCRLTGILLLPLLVAGCGGGDTYSVDQGQIAERFLPAERTVSHHPDSLQALEITEGDEKIQYELSRDYESLFQKWSCSFLNLGTGPSVSSPTYATLWSLELSLASLQPETGILTLRKKRARKLLERRREEYFDTIQIDVFWFVRRGGDGIVAGPGARTTLHVRDTTYRPVRSDHGPLREAFLSGGTTALYRRNMLYFPRTLDGTDILEGASKIRLEVSRTGSGSTRKFVWRWNEENTAVHKEDGPRATTASPLTRR
ncbi:hypothetical protein [Salinibacter sp.]|uniref:hypothetical protein n=1 Tax=Salinibacter sp. TaxID=2065818 RepID=UPI0035D50245